MNAEWADQPAAPDHGGVPGKTLAAQREAMGWTVEQVADQLKLAVRQVVALEAGDYAALPGPAVVRGFVRAYAKVVKVDAAPLVAMIPLDTPEPGDATATTVRRDKPASFSEVRFPTHGKRPGLPLVPIAGVLLLVAALAAAWHFGLLPASLLHGGAQPAATPAAAGAQASVTVLPAPVSGGQIETTLIKPDQELKPAQSTSVPLISVPPPAAAGGTPGSGSPAGFAPAETPVAAAAPGANPLVINVHEDSWVEVRRAKGAPLIARLVKGGSTETVDVSEPVTLVVGKPSAVGVTLRGAAVELPPVAGSTVSRVNLK